MHSFSRRFAGQPDRFAGQPEADLDRQWAQLQQLLLMQQGITFLEISFLKTSENNIMKVLTSCIWIWLRYYKTCKIWIYYYYYL